MKYARSSVSESADGNQAPRNGEECLFFGLNVIILAKAAGRNANALLICTHSGHLSAVRMNCTAFQPQ